MHRAESPIALIVPVQQHFMRREVLCSAEHRHGLPCLVGTLVHDCAPCPKVQTPNHKRKISSYVQSVLQNKNLSLWGNPGWFIKVASVWNIWRVIFFFVSPFASNVLCQASLWNSCVLDTLCAKQLLWFPHFIYFQAWGTIYIVVDAVQMI